MNAGVAGASRTIQVWRKGVVVVGSCIRITSHCVCTHLPHCLVIHRFFQLDAIDAAVCEVMFDGTGSDGTKAGNTLCDWWHHLACALASLVCTCKSCLGSELGLLRTDYHTITRRQHVQPALACVFAFAFVQHRYDMSWKDVLIPSCHWGWKCCLLTVDLQTIFSIRA